MWSCRGKLQNSSTFLKEDLSHGTEAERKLLYPYMKAAKVAGVKNSSKGAQLMIDGKLYTSDTIDEIPAQYHPSAADQ